MFFRSHRITTLRAVWRQEHSVVCFRLVGFCVWQHVSAACHMWIEFTSISVLYFDDLMGIPDYHWNPANIRKMPRDAAKYPYLPNPEAFMHRDFIPHLTSKVNLISTKKVARWIGSGVFSVCGNLQDFPLGPFVHFQPAFPARNEGITGGSIDNYDCDQAISRSMDWIPEPSRKEEGTSEEGRKEKGREREKEGMVLLVYNEKWNSNVAKHCASNRRCDALTDSKVSNHFFAQVLFYWWLPDSTFINLQPYQAQWDVGALHSLRSSFISVALRIRPMAVAFQLLAIDTVTTVTLVL